MQMALLHLLLLAHPLRQPGARISSFGPLQLAIAPWLRQPASLILTTLQGQYRTFIKGLHILKI
jgi:hypothetical protein